MASCTGGQQILLLLDVNGTICYRTKHRVMGEKWRCERGSVYAAQDNVWADFRMRHKFYYKRFSIEDFIKLLTSTGHFKVAVYSSMMQQDIQASLHALLAPQTRSQLTAVLDRDMNKPDPDGKDP